MIYDTEKLDLAPIERGPFSHSFDFGKEDDEIRPCLLRFERWREDRNETVRLGRGGRSMATAIEEVEEFEREAEGEAAGSGGEGALFGKLVHRLLEKVDWTKLDGIEEMAEAEARRLGASRSMILKAGEMVRRALRSEMIGRVLRSDGYQKEVPFAFKKGEILFEGVMDLVFKEGGDLVVLDFKTDLVEPEDLDSKIEHYRPQVEVYAEAIRNLFGAPPKEVILYFLHLMEPRSVVL